MTVMRPPGDGAPPLILPYAASPRVAPRWHLPQGRRQPAGARALLRRDVLRVLQPAARERQAAAADAGGQPVAEPLEGGDLLVEAGAPSPAQALPVARRRRAALGQGGQRAADLGEREADVLGGPHERQPPQH